MVEASTQSKLSKDMEHPDDMHFKEPSGSGPSKQREDIEHPDNLHFKEPHGSGPRKQSEDEAFDKKLDELPSAQRLARLLERMAADCGAGEAPEVLPSTGERQPYPCRQ